MTTSDDAFEARLRDLAALADGPPDHVLAAGRAAWELRDLDAQLAQLTRDSWRDADALATRAATDVRMLTFSLGDDLVVEVDVEPDAEAGRIRLLGAVTGEVVDVALVRTDDERTPVTLTEGQFAVPGVRRGAMRLELRRSDGGRVVTSWFAV